MLANMTRRIARMALCGLLVWGLPGSTTAQERQSTQERRSTEPLVVADLATGSGTEVGKSEAAPMPPAIFMEPGAIQSLAVDGLTRVAIGDPKVADVTVVSASELLLQAKAGGATTLILWDRRGQRSSVVEVIDRTPEAMTAQLRQVLKELRFADIQVTREGDKIFLSGQVPTKADVDRLKEILTAYEGMVTSLVTTPAVPPAPFVAPQSVKLTVQLVEITREGTEKLGVDWEDKLTFTETTFGAVGPQGVSLRERIDKAFKFGSLSRTGLNPVLNMLVSQGKARILAEPKLVAASGKQASTFLGVEVPIITATSISSGVVTQQIEFKQTGVELKFQPTVLADGRSIQLPIDAKVSSIDKTVSITVSGIVVPGFRIRHTQTEIVTESGQAVLIAGLIQDEEKKNLSQIPGVGSIPVLGNLFRSTEFTNGQTELILIVTPELTVDAELTADRAFALEQALASTEVAGSVTDPMRRYALQVQDRIAKALRYPAREQELHIGGRMKLRLHLFRDGALGRAVVSEPSGIEVFDQEALKAAQIQSPYPQFPSDLSQQDLWLEVPVLFRP